MAGPLVTSVTYTLKKLVEDIDLGEIALPDIQRPFVWPRTKVRDLLDSMYRGYPVGYLLFWENSAAQAYRAIGAEKKIRVPRLLIIDGQQRLTSLYAVMKGKPILNEKYQEEVIRIAFNPLEEKFEVANSSTEMDPAWISDISVLWDPQTVLFDFILDFLLQLKARRSLSLEEEKKIPMAIQKLFNIENYSFMVLEISQEASDEEVSEIFVRINSKGKPLKRSDFILTLMSVFWEEGRKELERFCREAQSPSKAHKPSPYTPHFQPSPEHLIRVSVALGFRRAKLEHVYSLLRGKDLQTGEFSEENRERQFAILKESQAKVLDLNHWHEFFNAVDQAGYKSSSLITSKVALLFSYALWLIGKMDFKVEPHTLRKVIAKWLFMSLLTERYTGSTETALEQDLALLREVRGSDDFVSVLEAQIGRVLTQDFWEITLPSKLQTSKARGPAQSAFYAAQAILEAPVLYSSMRVADLLTPKRRAKKAALELHHLFPRKYLERQLGIKEKRFVNQAANYALVEWGDNLRISDQDPRAYVAKLEERFSPAELREMYRLHALPEEWYKLDYFKFLQERRRRMAQIIREGFERIGRVAIPTNL